MLSVGTVAVAGFLDGLNPCAFTTLLLFAAALSAASAASAGQVHPRRRLLSMGGAYVGVIFLTYLALGAGLLATSRLLSQTHAPTRFMALLAVVLGLWMVKDVLVPELGPSLSAPHWLGERSRQLARKAAWPALLLGAFLIALCTVPCSGAIYVAVLGLLSREPSLRSYGLLLLYNLAFIAPLLALLLTASSPPAMAAMVRWNRQSGRAVKALLGALSILLGLGLLATL